MGFVLGINGITRLGTVRACKSDESNVETSSFCLLVELSLALVLLVLAWNVDLVLLLVGAGTRKKKGKNERK
jgi:hypothetical protein